MSKRQISGYVINHEVSRAINANRVARRALQQMIDERPGPQQMAMLIAKAAAALGENLDGLNAIQQIVSQAKKEPTSGNEETT